MGGKGKQEVSQLHFRLTASTASTASIFVLEFSLTMLSVCLDHMTCRSLEKSGGRQGLSIYYSIDVKVGKVLITRFQILVHTRVLLPCSASFLFYSFESEKNSPRLFVYFTVFSV